MRDKTADDYFTFILDNEARQRPKQKTTPPPTADQLWKAVCDWEPLGSGPNSDAESVFQLLESGRFNPIPPGKLRGETKLVFIPGFGGLTYTEFETGKSLTLEYADTNTLAISCPDGHPSEDQIGLKVKSEDATKLRQFAPFGWVKMQGSDGSWV